MNALLRSLRLPPQAETSYRKERCLFDRQLAEARAKRRAHGAKMLRNTLMLRPRAATLLRKWSSMKEG